MHPTAQGCYYIVIVLNCSLFQASCGGEAAAPPPDSNSDTNSTPTAQVSIINPTQLAGHPASSLSSVPLPPHLEDLPPLKPDFSAPPPYEVAIKLPTYEEVQREKTRLGEPQINSVCYFICAFEN